MDKELVYGYVDNDKFITQVLARYRLGKGIEEVKKSKCP